MKQFISEFSGIKLLACVALSAVLFSFYGIGGEGYTIRMGDRLLIEEHVTLKSPVPNFSLYQRDADEALFVYYSHCGQIGTSRSIAIKDNRNTVLKEWKYADAVSGNAPMVCKVKDILALQREAGRNVQLVYSSKEIPSGKVLAKVTLSMEGVARKD
jgi:hypothetical protein